MSTLIETVEQFNQLDEAYRSHGDTSINRINFLELLFGVDLNERDYSSLTQLKSHLREIATDTLADTEVLSSSLELLNKVEIILKNYSGEISTMPKGYEDIDSIEILLTMTETLSKSITRSIDPEYFANARYQPVQTKERHTFTDLQISRIKPQEDTGIQVGGFISEAYLLDSVGKVVHLNLKDRYHRLWDKQFFTFATTKEANDLVEILKEEKDLKAKTISKALKYLDDNDMQVRDELFLNVNREDLTEENNLMIINYRIGRSKQSCHKHKEVLKDVIYRASRAYTNPITKQKEDAWVIIH